mgnify:CR=1 FL=1
MSKSFDNFCPNCYTNNEKYFLKLLKSTKNRGAKNMPKLNKTPHSSNTCSGGGGRLISQKFFVNKGFLTIFNSKIQPNLINFKTYKINNYAKIIHTQNHISLCEP